jgi:hypothetical protein
LLGVNDVHSILLLLSIILDGVWKVKNREKVVLGGDVVSCLLTINDTVWAACESSVHIITLSVNGNKLVVSKVCHPVELLIEFECKRRLCSFLKPEAYDSCLGAMASIVKGSRYLLLTSNRTCIGKKLNINGFW